jgi:hypothetical protein
MPPEGEGEEKEDDEGDELTHEEAFDAPVVDAVDLQRLATHFRERGFDCRINDAGDVLSVELPDQSFRCECINATDGDGAPIVRFVSHVRPGEHAAETLRDAVANFHLAGILPLRTT